MSGIVELAALCIVLVVGVPLACIGIYLALMLAYGAVMLAYNMVLAALYAAAAPFWLALRAISWLWRKCAHRYQRKS